MATTDQQPIIKVARQLP